MASSPLAGVDAGRIHAPAPRHSLGTSMLSPAKRAQDREKDWISPRAIQQTRPSAAVNQPVCLSVCLSSCPPCWSLSSFHVKSKAKFPVDFLESLARSLPSGVCGSMPSHIIKGSGSFFTLILLSLVLLFHRCVSIDPSAVTPDLHWCQ